MGESEEVKAQLKGLRRKRGTVKSRLALFNKYLLGMEQKIVNLGDNQLGKNILVELNSRLEDANSFLNLFEEYQTEIESVCEDSSLEKESKERETFQDDFFGILSRAKQILNDLDHFKEDVENKSSSSRHSGRRVSLHNLEVNMSAGLAQGGPVKLPLINIPTFDGSFSKWLEFKDTYESLIHKNRHIGEIEKFYYLKASLGDSAKQVMESLEFSASNYQIAWETLCKRFDNKRMLVQNHISGIFDISPLKHESSEGLRNLCDKVYKHLRALETLGRPVQSWDDLLVFHLGSKLDRNSLKEWEIVKTHKEIATMGDFKEFLRGRADLLFGLEQTRLRFKDNIKSSYEPPKVKYKPREEKSFLTVNKKVCVVCKENHQLKICTKFLALPIYSRVFIIRRNKLCRNCFSPDHFCVNCPEAKCSKCGFNHNVLLHYDRAFSGRTENLEGSRVQGSGSTANLGNSSQDSELALLSSKQAAENSVRQKQVLLSTAVVRVMDAEGNAHECRVLLDSGSMSNFITEGLCERLGVSCEKVNISVVGISQGASVITKKCNLNIISRFNNFEMGIS